MLTYHGLFRFDTEQAKVLDIFATHYNHIYRKTYKIWCQQQDNLFLNLKEFIMKNYFEDQIVLISQNNLLESTKNIVSSTTIRKQKI